MKITLNFALQNMRTMLPLYVTVEAASQDDAIEPAIEQIRQKYPYIKGKGYIYLSGDNVREFEMEIKTA